VDLCFDFEIVETWRGTSNEQPVAVAVAGVEERDRPKNYETRTVCDVEIDLDLDLDLDRDCFVWRHPHRRRRRRRMVRGPCLVGWTCWGRLWFLFRRAVFDVSPTWVIVMQTWHHEVTMIWRRLAHLVVAVSLFQELP
jgi:hypothetical protein